MGPSRSHRATAEICLGLDCGGSSCRALAVDDAGKVVHRGQSGPANFASTPEDVLVENVRKAVDGCPTPAAICGCFAGLLTAADAQKAKDMLGTLFSSARIRVEADYAAALAAAPKDTDICVIAGTGSLICSRNERKVVKSGGRGYVLGDYGSAFRYGREFLLRHLEESTLENVAKELTAVFRTSEEPGILSNLYRSGPIAPKLARFAAAFAKAVDRGELFALDFLIAETDRLANLVISHAERWQPNKSVLRVGLAGGLWKISPIFEKAFAERLKEIAGGRTFYVRRLTRVPVNGAVILAKELLDEHGI